VGPRAGLDRCGKSRPPPSGIRSPDRPVRSQSLYRLIPGPLKTMVRVISFTSDVLTSCCIVKKFHDAGTTVYTLGTAVISFTKARVRKE
jgi:hypothetical protein